MYLIQERFNAQFDNTPHHSLLIPCMGTEHHRSVVHDWNKSQGSSIEAMYWLDV
jgi:hypothetical protein